MFWGLILEPQRRYSQVVRKSFRITMAALDLNSSTDEPTQVIVTFQNRNFLMCTLQRDKTLNEHLDLCFEEGDQVAFAANGNSHVHLTGYLMDTEQNLASSEEEEEEESQQKTTKESEGKRNRKDTNNLPPPKKSKTLELLENAENSDSEEDSDFSLSNTFAKDSSDEEDSESGEEEEGGEEEEVDDEEVEEEEEDDEDGEEEDEEEEEEEEIKPEVKSPKKQQNKNKQSQQEEKPKKNSTTDSIKGDKKKKQEKEKDQENTAPQKNGSPAKKRIVEGGVGIEELKLGNGPVARPGKFVQVYYEGRLKSNNKMFDSATKGSGFEFRLGRQEVIKGWDIGVAGMKVGGKRRITCPPGMAYGAKGSPPAIPPNSTLVFDIELKKVK